MSTLTTEPNRRATDEEIAAAEAWVEQFCVDWTECPAEYERALAVIVFANNRRASR